MKVSIIIPVFNRAFMLEQVINSLRDQSYANKELIFVDDGSTDESYKIILQNPDILGVKHENRGPASARNSGLKIASGEIVHFLDSDVIAPPDLIETHARFHRKFTSHIIQGQVVRILDLKDVYRIPMSFTHYSRPFFATGNVSVRKEFVDRVGGFDDLNFRKGWEDLDLGIRLRKAGLKVKRLYKQGFVWHYEGNIDSEQDIHRFFRKRYDEGKAAVSFYRKHPQVSVKLMTKAGRFFFAVDTILYNPLYFNPDSIYKNILSLWKRNKKNRAISKMRFLANHFYLQGLKDKIREEGYLLKKQ